MVSLGARSAIEDNIELIENNKFEELYDTKIRASLVSEVTQILLDAGINPLEHMSYVPSLYLADNDDIKSITIPQHIYKICESAFETSSIEEVIIPESVYFIEPYAFGGCTRLKHIELPQHLRYIEARVLCDCDSLTNIVIPDKVEEISHHAFSDCANLKEVTIPKSVRFIDQLAFFGCSINKIYYGGTKQQWFNLTNHEMWSHHPIIYCSDGNILE